MPFIRLSDNYIDHPKFLALSASAFRLWHEGMAFCRKHQTDGLIPSGALLGFRYYKAVRVTELQTPYQEGANPLWTPIDGFGVKVHDYLQWNLSKEQEQKRQAESKKRSQGYRSNSVRDVRELDRIGKGTSSLEEKDPVAPYHATFKPPAPFVDPTTDDIATQAATFCDHFVALYAKHRRGAKYRLKPSLDHTRVCDLLATWDLPRLEKLAEVLLTSDDDWITKTDRGIGVFAARATWCDDRLKAWEAEHGDTA